MNLPAIELPKFDIPFNIEHLTHPALVHFAIALPFAILFLEVMNILMKKKAVGGVSIFLMILTVLAAAGAYFSGLVDGKDAALTDLAKTALSEHKLLGSYLLLFSGLVLFLKLLSSLTKSGILKGLYLITLVLLVLGMFKQGDEGGDLVYEHGLNVKAVKVMDDKVFALEEALAEAQEKLVAKVEAAKNEAKKEEATLADTIIIAPKAQVAQDANEAVKPLIDTVASDIKEKSAEVVEKIKVIETHVPTPVRPVP